MAPERLTGPGPSPLGAASPAGTGASPDVDMPHAAEPIGTARQMYDGALSDELAVATYRNTERLFPTRVIDAGGAPSVLPLANAPLALASFAVGARDFDLEDFLAANRVAGLLVLKNGAIAEERYRYGNTPQTRWMSMSIAKSVTSTLIGAAVHDGHIESIDDPVTRYVPRLVDSAYDDVTVRDVLMMASGVRWNEAYTDPASERRRMLDAQIGQTPGALMALMGQLPRAAPPGRSHNYSTGETQVAGEILRNAIGRPLAPYLSEKIWSPAGMASPATWWLDSPDGVEIGGSGLSATLRDYGRFGLFMMNDGVIDGRPVLPPGWVNDAGSRKVLSGGAPLDYGYFWWIPGGRSGEDRAFYAKGIMGQHLYINRKEKVVIVVWGAQTQPTGAGLPMGPFFDAVVAALQGSA